MSGNPEILTPEEVAEMRGCHVHLGTEPARLWEPGRVILTLEVLYREAKQLRYLRRKLWSDRLDVPIEEVPESVGDVWLPEDWTPEMIERANQHGEELVKEGW